MDYDVPAIQKGGLVQKVINTVLDAQRRRMSHEEDWRENVRMLNGQFDDARIDPTLEPVDVSMFWSTIHSIVPAIYLQDPDCVALAMTPAGEGKAAVVEAAISHYLGEMDTEDVVHRVTVDAFCFPWGVWKIGYLVEDRELKVKTRRRTGQWNVMDESEMVDLSEFSIETKSVPVGDRPILSRVSPPNFLMDPRATGIEDARWVCERWVRHIDDVKADPMYRNTRDLHATGVEQNKYAPGVMAYGTVDVNIPATSDHGPFMNPASGPMFDEAEMVVGYEFWQKSERKLFVVVPGYDQFLRGDPDKGDVWPYEMHWFPYRITQLGVRVPDEPYPRPPLSQWKSQQRELNKIRSYILDHIKRATPKVFYDRDRVDKDVVDQIVRGDRLPLIGVGGNPSEIVQSMPGASMNPEVLQAEAAIKSDIRQITGEAEFNRAGMMPSGTTATEIRALQGSQSAKVAWMRRQVMKSVRWTVKSLLMLLKQFADKSVLVRLSGRTDFPWHPFDKRDLQEDYDVDVREGTQLQIDASVRVKQATDTFNLLAPIALQTGQVDFPKLLKWYLGKLDIPDPERFLAQPDQDRPPSDPQDEEVLLRAGGTPVVSPNDDHQQHFRVHQHGIQTEQDPANKARRMIHNRAHVKAMVEQRVQQMMGPGGPDQGGPGAPAPGGPMGGPAGPAGGLQGGMGRNQPQPGFPMAPRQMSEQPPSPDGILRGANRGTLP